MDGEIFSRSVRSGVEPAITAAELRHYLQTGRDAVLLDVRRAAAWSADPRSLPGALRIDPRDLDDLLPRLPRRGLIVACCVRGGPLSRYAVHILRGAGFDAWYLAGGREAWMADGGALRAIASARTMELVP